MLPEGRVMWEDKGISRLPPTLGPPPPFFCLYRTSGLVRSQDALARSHNSVSDVRQLLLLLRGQCWVWVGHGASGSGSTFLGEEDRQGQVFNWAILWSSQVTKLLPWRPGQ